MLCVNKLPSYFYDLISQDSAISRTVIGKLRNKHAQLQLHWIKGDRILLGQLFCHT